MFGGSHKSDFHNVTWYGSKMCHRSVTCVTCDTTRCSSWHTCNLYQVYKGFGYHSQYTTPIHQYTYIACSHSPASQHGFQLTKTLILEVLLSCSTTAQPSRAKSYVYPLDDRPWLNSINALPHMGNAEHSPTRSSPTSTDISRQAGMACWQHMHYIYSSHLQYTLIHLISFMYIHI